MKPELLRQANLKAVGAITAADPVLTDIGAAYSVIPGFTRNTILTSGPTMPWKDYVGGQRDADGRHLGRNAPRDDVARGRQQRAGQAQPGPAVEALHPRLDDEQNAPKARADDGPAPGAHAFTQPPRGCGTERWSVS